MNTETTGVEPFTDIEIEQLREVSGPVLLSQREVLAICQRFDDLRHAVDDHEMANRLNQATFDKQQLRALTMVEVLTAIRSSCVRWGDAGLVEAIDLAIAGIPPKPTTEQLSPTVRLDILTQAVRALVRCNPGEAGQVLAQLGQEVTRG